jgi:hypothetical protein
LAASSPWRYLDAANLLSRPFFAAAVLAPSAAPALARVVFRAAERADAAGLDRASVSAMTLLYGIQYFRGVREETGSLRDAIADYRAWRSAALA